jgi:hypothetical protein
MPAYLVSIDKFIKQANKSEQQAEPSIFFARSAYSWILKRWQYFA